MVLEACVVCVDNSEYMRNGDYVPSRMEAQADAVNLLCGTKTQSNAESTVGVLTMAGKGAEMLISPTQDLGKVLTSLHGVKIEGKCDLRSAIQVGALALKLRQNKNQRQRLVLFVGSPVTAESAALVSLGKKLKKNNVAVDVVDFSNHDANEEPLQAFVNAVASNDNSHFVKIPPGTGVLSDALVSTPVIMGEGGDDGGMAAAMAASGGGFPGGVDPSVDPELALALQLSMQEAEAAAAAANGSGSGSGSGDTAMADAPPATPAPPSGAAGAPPVPAPPAGGGELDETALIEQALAMSLQDGGAAPAGGAGGDVAMTDASEEDQIAAALAMSLEGAVPPAPPAPSGKKDDKKDEDKKKN